MVCISWSIEMACWRLGILTLPEGSWLTGQAPFGSYQGLIGVIQG